ncbi:DUF1211 domain-containing protein [Amycolatopsis acidicola]|uniref:DUF1211 domain-containing protein n=1 Tax=Amycolatopsis acidicola TaxID=2596893 RepID=A0A5N0UV19_9PSEU|nr:TMEM175 family protein [Amycolatopsis acidicola]KAA9154322.1 DUF1211 domain-containing protein [Amycolatopsis acidicola]
MPENKSPERLVFFTDAVVAIAITLLILPLADAVPEAVAEHQSLTELFSHNLAKIYSFLLSFAVISRLWVVHHHVFEQVKSYNRRLMSLNFGWLLTIVLLPFPTEITGLYGNEEFTSALYIGTILAASLFQVGMVLVIRRDHRLRDDDSELATQPVLATSSNAVVLAIAFVVAVFVPQIGYYMMLLLLLPPLAERIRGARAQVA